ncbi:MAG TPA: class 1 fructose-bisphosphatase [Steroidobacteraceae bacterium]|nr:class 1 fructose-bisphosphatase [Steroidobacteraceae bacterium]
MTPTTTGRSSVRSVVTLQAHVLQRQALHPAATGTFSWILSAISISAKMIAAAVRRARLEDVLGAAGARNVQGEAQQKLDVIANDILLATLSQREGVAILASEENEEPVMLRVQEDGEARYCVLFDPLDGSSNLDICGSVGTIFSILRRDPGMGAAEAVLQPGTRQLAAGYVLYGSSTVLVLTIGAGVDMFVLDPSIGAFVRVAEGLTIPARNSCYSLNEGNRLSFPQGYQDYLHWAQRNGYGSRYVGAMVGDVHRVLLQGGVFMYPPTAKSPQGKLRLMYEANPMAMLVEQAGGAALAGPGRRILEVQPQNVHQRCGVILGSAAEVEHVVEHLTAAGGTSTIAGPGPRLDPKGKQ